ncbi:MAG TPA: peptide MFS transporter [Chitinophagaceae bacterium]|jgi:POT family proton-dependent oligopeptide transporter|nr:peptide MFS transporter [Chitinophagaceae bacterium]
MTNVTAGDQAILQQASSQKGHPKGLWVLFGTEMWERFNFYGMRALLSLFLAEALLMGKTEASIIYGGFLGLCYLTPMLGGYISDKFLGNRNCILLGGTVMGTGQILLFFSGTLYATNISLATTVMWIALLAIIFGNGFFKPNISSMVGSLYPKEQKGKLDSAFTLFYLGINVGATLGQFICPFFGDIKHDGIRDLSAFKWGFLAAGLAMFIGTLTFLFLKNKYVRTPEGVPIGGKPKKSDIPEGESESAKFTTTNMVISFVLMLAITYGLHLVFAGPGVTWIKSWLYPFIFASGISLGFLILSDKTITKVEKDRIWVLYVVCFFVMFFWGAFEQAGSSLTFIADNQTDTNILGWNMPPSMVQNFNGIFVMVFAIPFSYLWIWMNKKKLEPISPVKQAWGLMLIALGYFIIATQVKGLGISGKVGIIWMVVLYLLHTWGELCLSPIGLSLVAKLAPKRFASLLMGVWFLGNAGGYVLTGILGALLPPTSEAYINMDKENIKLESILEGQKPATGAELFTLAKNKIATTVDYDKGFKNNLDFVEIFKAKDSVLTAQQLDIIEKEKIITVGYPKFAGFTLKTIYDFFMLFVVLCGLAGLVLYGLSPILKKMMHGVR